MLCKQRGRRCDAVLNLTLTCYGKQRRNFQILATWWTRTVILNFVIIILLWFLGVNKRWRRGL